MYLQARMEDAAECMLVLIGATPEGKKELVGFQTGVREGAQSWRELLIDIKQRGAWVDQDARLTVITLNRGSRSMWTSKTNWPGQVESVRSSATVLATIGIPDSTSTLRLSR